MNVTEERFEKIKGVVSDSDDYDFGALYADYKDEIDSFADEKFSKYLIDLEERYNDTVHSVYKHREKFMVLHQAAVGHSSS